MTTKELRAEVFNSLEGQGFHPAESLPDPDPNQSARPATEIAARLMALDALFTWVAFSEDNVPSERVRKYIDRNGLLDWLTEEENEIISLPRSEAHEQHVNTIGWKLENMWALAWVLGFEPEPSLEAAQVGDEITRPMLLEFLPGLDATIDELVNKSSPRTDAEVVAKEYLFYCTHNAVRSAQLGGDTVPEGFHPIIHGGAIHERRHSLTWCISPETPWDETDLST